MTLKSKSRIVPLIGVCLAVHMVACGQPKSGDSGGEQEQQGETSSVREGDELVFNIRIPSRQRLNLQDADSGSGSSDSADVVAVKVIAPDAAQYIKISCASGGTAGAALADDAPADGSGSGDAGGAGSGDMSQPDDSSNAEAPVQAVTLVVQLDQVADDGSRTPLEIVGFAADCSKEAIQVKLVSLENGVNYQLSAQVVDDAQKVIYQGESNTFTANGSVANSGVDLVMLPPSDGIPVNVIFADSGDAATGEGTDGDADGEADVVQDSEDGVDGQPDGGSCDCGKGKIKNKCKKKKHHHHHHHHHDHDHDDGDVNVTIVNTIVINGD